MGHIFGAPVVATALLDRLLHHSTDQQIEGESYRRREHADLVPENIRSKSFLQPAPIPPTLKRRGRPSNSGGLDQNDVSPNPPNWEIFTSPLGDSPRH